RAAAAAGGGDEEKRSASGMIRLSGGGKIDLQGSGETRVAQAVSYLQEISELNDPIERNRQMIQLVDQLSASEYRGVMEKFRAEGGLMEDHRSEYAMLLHGWVKQDPIAAVDYIAEIGADDWAKETVIGAWAMADPASAVDYVNELEDDGRVNNWMVGLVRGISRQDPKAALLTLQQLPKSHTRGQAIRSVFHEVVKEGGDYAMDWLETVEEGGLRNYAANSLADRLAQRDVVAASQWAENIKDVEARKEAAEEVTERWAYQDLDAAKGWVERLPEDTRSEAAEGVARRLGQVDPEEGARWLTQLGEGEAYDGARIRFVREAAQRDPEQALAVVASIKSQGHQARYYNETLGRWARQDRQAVTNWVLENRESIPGSVFNRFVPKEQRR
ncbi:MAG: hypothetical protein ACQKBY_03850, partial [Verrucomicrobiales bacterium]